MLSETRLGIPKVLLLDDEERLAETIKDVLSGPGLQLFVAITFEQGLTLARENEFSAALIGLRIGSDGKDGIDFACSVRELNPLTRLLFYTGSIFGPEVSEKLRNLGLEHCALLPKAELGLSRLREPLDEAIDAYTSDNAVRQSQKDPRTPFIQFDTVDLALYQALSEDPRLLHTMNWRKFERLLADVLETLEYEVELQKGTKDGGIDIIALKRSTEWGDHRYLLQAKRWKNRIGLEPVQRLLFLKGSLRATKCCLATTSTFTRGAWALANDYRWELELRDFNGLREWIERALLKRTGHPKTDR